MFEQLLYFEKRKISAVMCICVGSCQDYYSCCNTPCTYMELMISHHVGPWMYHQKMVLLLLSLILLTYWSKILQVFKEVLSCLKGNHYLYICTWRHLTDVSLTPHPLCAFCVVRCLDSWFKTTAMSTATGTPPSLWESGFKRRRLGLDEKISSLCCWCILQMISFCTGSRSVWNRYENADQSHQGQGKNCCVFKNGLLIAMYH